MPCRTTVDVREELSEPKARACAKEEGGEGLQVFLHGICWWWDRRRGSARQGPDHAGICTGSWAMTFGVRSPRRVLKWGKKRVPCAFRDGISCCVETGL